MTGISLSELALHNRCDAPSDPQLPVQLREPVAGAVLLPLVRPLPEVRPLLADSRPGYQWYVPELARLMTVLV